MADFSRAAGGFWRVEVSTAPAAAEAFREISGPVTVSDGRLFLTNYESLTMAAQFRDVSLPAEHQRDQVILCAPGKWCTRSLPDGALVFAENGFGDHLFLKPGDDKVFVLWHEGGETEEYGASIAELRPDLPRVPSDHPPITYWSSEKLVRLGDRVKMRYWLVLGGQGEVVYVPGVSAHKPSMERDGLAWVGVRLDDGARVDTIVMPDGALKKSVSLLARRSAADG